MTSPLARPAATFASHRAALESRDRASLAADLVMLVAVAVLLYLLIRLSYRVAGPIVQVPTPTEFSTNPLNLPYYALRSLTRMFTALGASLVFTFVYATAAAKSRRAERVLIPLLDVLQSVPVLGFLSITITLWLAMFPGTELGVELASIFAIFTAQVWNLTFAFYQAQVTQSKELAEAAVMFRLNRWQRFWRLDAPSGVIPLVWNGMMSFGGGWFFLIASEVITVNRHEYALPGIGSFVATASNNGETSKVWLAIAAMMAMVIGVDLLFWRPLVAWSARFRTGDEVTESRSAVLNLLRRSNLPRLLARLFSPLGRAISRAARVFGQTRPSDEVVRGRAGDWIFNAVVLGVIGFGLVRFAMYVHSGVGIGEFAVAARLGGFTFLRVIVLLVFASLIWVPIGVWIGLNPTVARFAQPVVQVLASFPANFLFPFIGAFLIATNVSLDIGGVVLMALGAQWYILFNVIAGAAAIPRDLRDVAANLRLGRVARWRTLYGPAVFTSWVTGSITAAGGAWNASIVAEVVTFDGHTLTAHGLGAYITTATTEGDLSRTLIGVVVMSLFVVGLNRLVWQPLYTRAERRYTYA